MTRKFKLIKTYPGSPEIGTEILSPFYQASNGQVIPGITLEAGGYAEFWEEVVEDDYEIVSVKNYKNDIFIRLHDGVYNSWSHVINDDNILGLINAKSLFINSIKRKSDGQIFTVGDKVIHTNPVPTKIGKIESFAILSNGIWFYTDQYHVPMIYIEGKYVERKLILSTSDGVLKHEGDSCYYVDGCRTGVYQMVLTDKTHNEGAVYFDKEYKALAFLNCEQPVLTINELKRIPGMNITTTIKDMLIDKVRMKLKAKRQ